MLLESFADQMRPVQMIQRTESYSGYKAGESFSPPVEAEMIPQPTKGSDMRFYPEGMEVRNPMSFWHSGETRALKHKDRIQYNGLLFEVMELQDRTGDGGFTKYLTMEVSQS